MKLPNGFGSVYKLKDRFRRRPWMAVKTMKWNIDEEGQKTKQVRKTIGFFATKQEAIAALTHYNENPYDLDAEKLTFSDVYEKWSSEYFATIGPSSARTVTAAYRYCKPIYDMRMKDLRVEHLEQTIRDADVGASTKSRIKSLFNLMYKYAMRHEIVDKDYAQLCNGVKRESPQIIRVPFSDQEIESLWQHLEIPFVDMILIGIYSGWRPQELAVLKISDVDLENMTYTGGLKTDAGKNRIVPIHSLVTELVIKNYDQAVRMGSEYLFNDPDGQQGTHLTYDKYRGRFRKVMSRLDMDHKPHDTRHTFITKGKEADMNEYLLKMIVGHEIRDVTEKVYTHRTIDDLKNEIEKIKK